MGIFFVVDATPVGVTEVEAFKVGGVVTEVRRVGNFEGVVVGVANEVVGERATEDRGALRLRSFDELFGNKATDKTVVPASALRTDINFATGACGAATVFFSFVGVDGGSLLGPNTSCSDC